MKLQNVRGTRDIFGKEALLFQEIYQAFINSAQIYDFQEMQTPIFEFTQVFKRSLGDDTDIVNKEMYTFEDRSGDSLTLRPEGTASVARAVISNSMLRDLPLKLYYSGPMFRHERPQKGRYRQFTQMGIELIGAEESLADIEVIACAWSFFKSCGLQDKIKLEINSIGDDESRKNYRHKLLEYFSKYKEDLSSESQNRLQTNPLRILDSKEEKDKRIVAGAPNFTSEMNETSQIFFHEVLEGLRLLKIPFEINQRLVRGLDYYNHTVFEFTTEHLGAQNAVLSGGRYNNLIEAMGGTKTAGVGWAAGVDRLALLLGEPQARHETVGLIAASKEAQSHLLCLLEELREHKIPSQTFYSGNISKQMKKANNRHCSHVIVLGDEELKNKMYSLKNLKTGEQSSLNKNQLLQILKKFFNICES